MSRLYPRLHDQAKQIIKMIETEQVCASDIAERLGVSRRTVYRRLNALRKVGYDIESINLGNESYYFIKSKKEDV